jgi:hypothetical protein
MRLETELTDWGGELILRDADRPVSRVKIELLGSDAFAVHVDTLPDYQGRGLCSRLVDSAVETLAPRRLIFEDDPEYLELGGRGSFSPAGQAWADSYRLARGLPLPPYVVSYYMGPLVSREGPHAA